MNKLLVALILLAAPAHAALVGKFDLSLVPTPIIVRDLQDGLWEIGGQLHTWTLTNAHTGDVWVRAGIFGAWRLELQDPVFGVYAGVPFSAFGTAVANGIAAVSQDEPSAPPWLKKASSYLSLNGYAGWRPHYTPPDDHQFMYGVGAEVNVRFQDLQLWAKGTPDVKTDGNNGAVVIPAVKGL